MALTRRSAIAGLAAGALLLAACGGPPPGADPLSTVQRIYDPYVAKKNPPDLINAAPWTGEMGALIARVERQEQRTHDAIIEFDPIVNGSDWDISNLHLELSKPPTNGEAQVRARFINLGDETVVTFALKQEGGGWRIDNIAADNWTLRQQFANAGITPQTRDPS